MVKFPVFFPSCIQIHSRGWITYPSWCPQAWSHRQQYSFLMLHNLCWLWFVLSLFLRGIFLDFLIWKKNLLTRSKQLSRFSFLPVLMSLSFFLALVYVLLFWVFFTLFSRPAKRRSPKNSKSCCCLVFQYLLEYMEEPSFPLLTFSFQSGLKSPNKHIVNDWSCRVD